MSLNESQVKIIKEYLHKNNIETKSIFNDLLDHICCKIEDYIDNGFSFGEALKLVTFDFTPIEIKNTELSTLKFLNMETYFSKRISFLATIPFILFGLCWLSSSISVNIPTFILLSLFYTSFLSMFILFGIGWTNNFPRWSFHSIGFCVIISLCSINVRVPSISNLLLGALAFIPLILTLTICVLIKPSMLPIKELFRKIKSDKSLIWLMLYGTSPLLMAAIADEIISNWMILVVLLSMGFITTGLYLYLNSNKKIIRNLSIVIAFILASVTTIITNEIYW